MWQSEQVEQLISLVSELDRESLVRQFATYRASFPVDFTTEFLEVQPIDRLRHLFVAMCLQSRRLPEVAEPTAA